jgi:hypothetical protein
MTKTIRRCLTPSTRRFSVACWGMSSVTTPRWTRRSRPRPHDWIKAARSYSGAGLFGHLEEQRKGRRIGANPYGHPTCALDPVTLLHAAPGDDTRDHSDETIFQGSRRYTATGIDHDRPVAKQRGTVMQHEHTQIQFDDLADVLKSAHLRRSADIGKWLREFLDRRRQERLTATPRRSNEIVEA